MTIIVDIDETICHTEKTDAELFYHRSEPFPDYIEKINKLYDEGHTIIYWTSRGTTKAYGPNWFHTTLNQLNEWGCKFHELRLGKPHYDMIICDKSKRIEEI